MLIVAVKVRACLACRKIQYCSRAKPVNKPRANVFDRSSKKTFLCDPQKITEILSLSLSLSLPVRSALLYFFVRLSFVPWPKRGNKRLEMQPPFQESFVYPWQSFLEIPINGRSAGRWWSERRACVRVWGSGACDSARACAHRKRMWVSAAEFVRFRAVTFASVLASQLRQPV